MQKDADWSKERLQTSTHTNTHTDRYKKSQREKQIEIIDKWERDRMREIQRERKL